MAVTTNTVVPENSDNLASMAIVPASESDNAVAFQRNQDPALDSRPNDEDESLDEYLNLASNRSKNNSKARAKRARKAQIQTQSAAQPTHGSLRPALDILSRIRHDHSLQEEDFVVGYSDRHTEVKELPVTLWKADVTDEEFIPQHRILYFRRQIDDVKVWDRAERLDLIFGSGKGALSEVDQIGTGEQKRLTEDKNESANESKDEESVKEAGSGDKSGG